MLLVKLLSVLLFEFMASFNRKFVQLVFIFHILETDYLKNCFSLFLDLFFETGHSSGQF